MCYNKIVSKLQCYYIYFYIIFLITILELDETHSILLNALENDTEKQTKILDMKDEIQKYFAVSCLTPFKPNATCKRPYIKYPAWYIKKARIYI